MDPRPKPRVAVLNTSPDFIDVLTEILDMEGFETRSDYIIEFRTGRKDPRSFFAAHAPQVVVYDVAIPYMENWSFFKHIQTLSGLQPYQFIAVTTNKAALETFVGPTECLEIIGKPFDFDALIHAIRRSLDDGQ
jgi:CheY-like chemotaxis protein